MTTVKSQMTMFFLAIGLCCFGLLLYVSYVTLLLQSHKGTSDKTTEEASFDSQPHSLCILSSMRDLIFFDPHGTVGQFFFIGL